MAMDMNAAVKISASVSGISAIDDLKRSIDGVSTSAASIKGRFDAVSGSLKAFAAIAGVTAFAGFAKGVVSSVAALDDMSEKTGASVENLSALQSVAKISGVDIEQVGDALVKLTKSLKGQDEGSRGAAEALKYLGIAMQEFRALDPAEQMLKVAKAMDGFKDGAGKTALALDLFGKSGANMLPFLKDLAEEGKLNGKITAEQASSAEALEKNVARLSMQLESWKKSVAVSLIPVLRDFVQGLRDASGEVGKFGENEEIVRFAEKGALALAALVDVIVTIGKALRALAGSFEAVFADMSLLGSVAGNGVQAIFSEESRGKLKTALDERNKIVDAANQRYADLWTFNGSANFDAVRSRIGQSYGPQMPSADKPAATYNPVSDKADADAKKLETQINQIEKYRLAQDGAIAARKAELVSVTMTTLEYKNLADAKALDLKNAELSVGLLPDAKAKLDAVTESLKSQTKAFNDYEDSVKRTPMFGAQTFLKSYLDDVTNVGKQTQKVMEGVFKGTEDALVNFVMTGKLNFKDLADSIMKDLVRMAIKAAIMQPLANMMGGFLGIGSASAAPVTGSANGNVFSGGAVQAFASGGVVTRPTLFPMARGAGLMGEAGPEAIMPLRRGADGKLGVAGAGGSTIVNVNVHDQNDSKVSVQQSQGANGSVNIDVLVEQAVSRSIAKNGGIAQTLQNRYGLNRAGGR